MKYFCLSLSMLLLIALMPALAMAGRTELPVQGYILDTNTGEPINASLPMTFKIYEDCEADTVLWSVRKIIDFDFGLYSTTIEPDEEIILENSDLCLGITIADDNEMNPRLAYHAVPYTIQASKADYAEISGIALDIDENNLPGMVGAGLSVTNHEINLDTTYSQTWTGVQTYNSQVIVSKNPDTTSSNDAAFKINPTTAVSGAKAFVIQDNGSDTFTINKEGDVVIAGNLTVTGQLNLSAVGDITSVNAGNGLAGGALFGDASLSVDQSFVFDWTGAHTFDALATFNTDTNFVFSGTENLSFTSDLAGDVNVLQILTTPSSTAGNANGIIIQQQDSANTNGLDVGLWIDNADSDLALTTALKITGSSTGLVSTALDLSDAEIDTALAIGNNDITVGGATISATELAALDNFSAASIGDIISVTAGDGLTGGGASGALTLSLDEAFSPSWSAFHDFLGGVGMNVTGTNQLYLEADGNIVHADGLLEMYVNVDTNVAVDGIHMDLIANTGITAGTDITGMEIAMSAADDDADVFGVALLATNGNALADSYEAAIKIDNADTTAGSMKDGIIVTASGGDTVVTDGLDVSDGNIVNAINIGNNNVLVGGVTISSTEFASLDNFSGASIGDITAVTAGGGLTGGGASGDLTLDIGAGNAITVNANDVAVTANSINEDELAATLTFADGDYLDLSAILHNDTALQGLRLPQIGAAPASPLSGEGFVGWDETTNLLKIYTGSAWTTVGSVTDVSAGNGLSNSGSSAAVVLDINAGAGLELSGDAVRLAAAAAGSGLTGGAGSALAVGAGTGITVNADDVAVSTGASFAWSGDHTFTFTETEDLAIDIGISATNAGQAGIFTLTNSSTSGNQFGLYLDNAASTGTTEALLALDNSDTDTAVSAAIKIIDAGGGFTNILDVNGVLISATELTALDGFSGTSIGDVTAVGSMTSGIAFGDATADDDWLGLGSSAGKIEFDDQGTDEVNILNARVGIGTSTPQTALDTGSGLISGGVYSAEARNTLNLSSTPAASSQYSADLSFVSGGVFRMAEASVLGTNDIFFQLWPATTSGYGYLEAWASAGMVVGTGNATPVIFKPNRSEAVRILSSGKVGIGDTSADQLLEVMSSGAAATQVTVSNTNAGDYDPQIGFELADGANTYTLGIDDSDSDKFKLSTTALGTSDLMTIDSSGNATFTGTLTYSGGSIAGDMTSVGSMTSGLAFGDATADDDWLGLGAGVGRIEFDDQATDEVNILTANVGIGTATPGDKLEVTGGNIIIGDDDAWIGASSGNNIFWNDTTGAGGLNYKGSLTINIDSNDNDADTEALYIAKNKATLGATGAIATFLESGKVGIGDTNPASMFTVGSGDLFQVDSSGNIVKLNNITYSWPSSQAAGSGYVLSNDSAGTLTWVNPALTGDITGVTASTGLSGGGTSGTVSLSVDQSFAPTWTGLHTFNAATTTTKTFSADGGPGQYVSNITLATPVDTGGANIHEGLKIAASIGNASGGTNTANMLNLGGSGGPTITGDDQVTLNAISIGNLTASAATETAIKIGSGWDTAIDANGTSISLTELAALDGLSASNIITTVGSMTDGTVFADSTADDDWLGLGSSDGRIEFDNQATDEVNILNANVGIGTATPNNLLQVKNMSDGGAIIQVGGASADSLEKVIRFGDSTYVSVGESTTDDTLQLKGTRISMVGSVGMGDTTPDQLLEVMSSGAAATQVTVSNTNAGDYDPQIGFELADGANTYTLGIDDSDSDKFKLSTTALGTGDLMTIDSSGNATFAGTLTYSGGSIAGDILGVTASTGLSGGGTSGTVSLSVDQSFAPTWTGAHTFSSSATTTDTIDINALSLTSGQALQILGPSGGTAGITGSAFYLGSDLGNGGKAIESTVNIDSSTAGSTAYNLKLSTTNNATDTQTTYGIYNYVTDNGNYGNADRAYYSRIDNYGTSADSKDVRVVDLVSYVSGATGGTTNVYGLYTNIGAYGNGATVNGYGVYISNNGMDATGTTTNYGLYVDAMTGADANYAAIFAGGNVGIGDTTPTALLTVGNGDKFLIDTSGNVTASGTMNVTNTLTASTVDINGGAIDGTIIGANSAAAGTFAAVTATSLVLGAGTITGAGLTDCDTSNQKLGWDTTTSKFTCISNFPDTAYFTDSTSDTMADNSTTDLWDGTYPNITPTSTSQAILLSIAIKLNGTNTDNEYDAFQLYRTKDGTTSPSCTASADNIVVGPVFGNFTTDISGVSTATFTFIDSPAVSTKVQYTVCSDSSSIGTVDNTLPYINVSLVALGADLAENYYTTDATIEAGHVVAIDSSLPAGVKKSQKPYDGSLLGIVSTSPGHVLDDAIGKDHGRAVPVALSGRVPVKVTTHEGKDPIHIGDYLTASETPGIAMKATRAGQVIAKALTEIAQGEGAVLAFVEPGWQGVAAEPEIDEEAGSAAIVPDKMMLKSPGGKCFRVEVSDEGQLTSTPAACEGDSQINFTGN